MRERERCLRNIQTLGFVLVDTNLYLDTHPCDSSALCYFQEQQQRLAESVVEYEERYGRLTAVGAPVGERWDWVDSPWPWELREV